MIAPANDLARFIEAGLQILKAARSIEVVTHVVFARPEKLDRGIDLLRDPRRLDHVIVGEATAETAAAALQMNGDRRVRNAECFGDEAAAASWDLRVGPNLDLASLPVRETVLRFERRMRDEWIRIRSLDDLRGLRKLRLGIAVLAQHLCGRLFGQLGRPPGQFGAGFAPALCFVPAD